MEINDQDFLDFGTGETFSVGGQISPGAIASAQVDKADAATTNDLSPTRIAETVANSVKINPSPIGDGVASIANKPITDFRKFNFFGYDEEMAASIEAEPTPIKIEVNPLAPAAVVVAAAEPPKPPASQLDSGYSVEGSKSRNEDGTFKVSLTLKDLTSNVIISDALVVNEKQLDVAYAKAVEELKMPLAMRAGADVQSNAIINSMNLGRIQLPSVDELTVSPTSMKFEETRVVTTNITPAAAIKAESTKMEEAQAPPSRIEAPARIETTKTPTLALVPEIKLPGTPTPVPTPAMITKTVTAETTPAKSSEFIFGSLLGSDLLKPFMPAKPEETVQTEQKTKFSDSEILSAMFGSGEPSQAAPAPAATPEVRVESSKPIPNKSLINEIVNPPNPVVPALEGLGQTIANTSNSMTDTLAGKMESAFGSQVKGGASQTLANNVTNITNAQSPQIMPAMAESTPKTEPAKTSESEIGGGMSEYYLRAIYEALVVQGVKLRTI